MRPLIGALLPLCSLLLAATPVLAQQVEWKDSSPHAVRYVTVDQGVQIEVLDWGGSGPEIVLLAGLGGTAHMFDDFAPMLASRSRVIAMTRRGHRGSSASLTGYQFGRLADDVVRVIDVTGLKRPVMVGHSLAGEELHVLGTRYPARVAGLVYIDAAFNRADGSEDYDAVEATLPAAPRPSPTDLMSFAALRSFLEKTYGPAGPEAHLRLRYARKADGSVAGLWTPDRPVFEAMSREIQAGLKDYNPEPIRVPALAIYAVPTSADDLMRMRLWYKADDAALRQSVQTLYGLAREQFARHARWFEGLSGGGRVTQISGPHDLFISNPHEVLREIDGSCHRLRQGPERS